ncbi:hypothetical protein T12_15082 [Trichinella patagoniensis]|uniref:Uncharacterized protein n=1 Tax=Trichinella patagoniensis TaxID=990121 RepID=A0A0V0ZQH9_9BILA|nr:hypothetical protein T12_15082 [Trichinella patagoniensis]
MSRPSLVRPGRVHGAPNQSTGIARQFHSPSLVRRWRGRSLPASSATLLRPFPGKCRRREKVCAACKHLYRFPDRPPL